MEEIIQGQEQSNLFDDHIEYTMATQGQRFVNWLVDNLLMRFGLSYLTGTVVGYLLAKLYPEYMTRIIYSNDRTDLILIGLLISIFNYLIYYTFCEKVFKGYTLGKLISGTRAIRMDGQELTFKDAFLRSLCRIVPFEVFSGFGDQPWHDTWTKTGVIKAR